MLRAWLWRRSGDPAAATRTAMRAGAISAYVALAAGIFLLVSGRLFAGSIVAIAGLQILSILSARYTSIGLASQVARERNGATVSEAMVPRDQAAG